MPISLVGSLYKIVEKLLASRLKNILGGLTSLCQSAVMLGRKILDGVFVANEVVDQATREKKDYCMFKVDVEKAYDCVSWDLLRFMIKRMGFCSILIGWMEACIFNSHMSILVNGILTKDFKVERGLRHVNLYLPSFL